MCIRGSVCEYVESFTYTSAVVASWTTLSCAWTLHFPPAGSCYGKVSPRRETLAATTSSIPFHILFSLSSAQWLGDQLYPIPHSILPPPLASCKITRLASGLIPFHTSYSWCLVPVFTLLRVLSAQWLGEQLYPIPHPVVPQLFRLFCWMEGYC